MMHDVSSSPKNNLEDLVSEKRQPQMKRYATFKPSKFAARVAMVGL